MVKSIAVLTGSLVAALLLVRDGSAAAQPMTAPRYGGIGAVVAVPRDAWGDLTGIGIGGEVVSSAPLTSHGLLRLRSGITLLYHLGAEHDVPEAQLQPGDQITLRTTASMFHIGIGPELANPEGRTRGYVFGTVGFTSMWVRTDATGQTVPTGALPYNLQLSKNSSAFAWSAGGGVRVMTRRGAMLDLGAEYRSSLSVHVLQPADVHDDGVRLTYGESTIDANQIIMRLGYTRIGK